MKDIYFMVWLLISGMACTSEKNEKVMPVQSFMLKEVKLLDGPFKHATDLNIQSLLNYGPDRLLAKFRMEAGLKPKAEHYHGWEDNTIAGHSLGHYLEACALMYQTSQNQEFFRRVEYIVDELGVCQLADGDGYIGAFPNGKKILEEEVAKGDIRAQGFDLNGIWVPFYTQHKVMAGLRDAYRLCGLNKALTIEERFADWLETIIDPLNDSQMQEMLHCEHGGINEVLVDLYTDTGDERYLKMSQRFHHKAVLDSLALGYDVLPGLHGNTQIPKVIGVAKRYKVTRNTNDYKTATFFWDRVVNHHSYATGGHGNHEYFGMPDKLSDRLSDGTTESCNVYNMLKLSRLLFEWEPQVEIADYFERALFNHILASQHPENGRVIYNLSLEMGGHKTYQDPEWFTCCVGTGMENHSKYGQNIFFYNDQEIYVSQFIGARVEWKENGITLVQTTKYPEEQGTTLHFEMDEPKRLTLYVRYPYWAKSGINIKVNDKPWKTDASPGAFIPVKRKWKSGDIVTVHIPFDLRLETMPDNPNRVVIMYGPLVMAGDLGSYEENKAEIVPVLMTENRDPETWIKKEKEPNTFRVSGVGHPDDFIIKPFYATHDRRYSVYWDMFTQAGWQNYQNANQAEIKRLKMLDEMTYDYFRPGEMQPERDHHFIGEKTEVIEHKHQKARVASRGGWFAFEMKVMMGQPMALIAEYWGGFTGSKTFDILINDQKIATENISGKADGRFIQEQYDIPAEFSVHSNKVTVKFLPHVGHRAGPVFGVRTIKR